MNTSDLSVFAMLWLTDHAQALVAVLQALAPVLSVCVAGYALHILARRGKK